MIIPTMVLTKTYITKHLRTQRGLYFFFRYDKEQSRQWKWNAATFANFVSAG